MTNFKHVQSSETTQTQGKMQDCQFDSMTIMRQIRLCRSILGAILDELEGGNAGADAGAIERIAECTTGVTAEIESLWEAIGKSK
jgi:hypothetical protein